MRTLLNYLSGLLLTVLTAGAALAAPFQPGSLIVVRVGSGAAALTSAATAVFLDEYTPDGILRQSLAVTTTASGTNRPLTASGTATAELQATRSADGRFVVITGYDAAVGTASVAGTAAATVPRVIGRVDGSGVLNTSTRISDAFDAGGIRAATLDQSGNNFFAVGSNSGVRAVAFGSAGTSTLTAAAPANNRYVGLFGGQVYVSSSSAATLGISRIDGATNVLLPGLATSTGNSPYAFFLTDLSTDVAGLDVAYVADDRATGGGIQKYSLVGGSWVLNGTISTAAAPGPSVRGLSGRLAAGTVSLAATGADGLYLLSDATGYNVAPTAVLPAAPLAAAPDNTAFRGVAFAPGGSVFGGEPEIFVAPIGPLTFSTPTNTASATQRVSVSGMTQAGGISVTASAGYEIALAAEGPFASTITLSGVNGNVPNNVLFLRLAARATAGAVNGTLTAAGGFARSQVIQLNGTVTVPGTAVPTITSFTPTSGGRGTVVTITGTNLAGATAVTLNGVALTTADFTLVNATTITFVVPATATSGVVGVTTAGGTAMSTGSFTFVPGPLPTVSGFTPASGPVGTVVTVTGTNLNTATAVTVGSTAGTSLVLVSATELRFTVAPGTAAGTVRVTNPEGTASSTASFTVVPALTSLSPVRAVAGGPAFVLTVTGSGFSAATRLLFGGNTYTPVAVNAAGTSFTTNLPAALIATAGIVQVSVFTGAATSNVLNFFVVPGPTTPTFEDFETGTRTDFTAAAPVALRSGSWTFSNAIIGEESSDKVNQIKAVRLRGTGFIAMNFDKPNGAGTVTISAALFGTNTGSTFTASISTDGGATYAPIAGVPATLTATLTPYVLTVNQPGNVRLRFGTTSVATSGALINLDDLIITDRSASATRANRALPGLKIYPNPAHGQLTVTLPQAGAARVALHDLAGRLVLAPAALPASGRVLLPAALPAGVYLLEVRQGAETAVRRVVVE